MKVVQSSSIRWRIPLVAKLVGFGWQAITRRVKASGRCLAQIGLLAAILFLCSGYLRGAGVDASVAGHIAWLQDGARQLLSRGWVESRIAHVVVAALTYAVFAGLLLFFASIIRQVPSYIGFLILSELNRRQGRNICKLELLLGLSMPTAATIAIATHGAASLLACIHFIFCYAYVRLSNQPHRVDNILNWYVRIRTSMDSGDAMDDDTEHDLF